MLRTSAVELVASPAARDVWRSVVNADAQAMPSQTPEWTATLPPQWVDASRLYETREGLHVVVPLAAYRLGGSAILGSYPRGLGFGGYVADRGVSTADIAAVISDITANPRVAIAVWPNPLQIDEWARAVPAKWLSVQRRAHIVDLNGGLDDVWARMSANARRGVRRAERAGVTIETDSSDALIATFFELFAESQVRWSRRSHEPLWLARWRSRADGPCAWRRITRALGDRCRISVARWEGEPVASVIVLHGPNAHYTHGAMRQEAGRCYANYALHWHEMSQAVTLGERYYHMGESGAATSLARFKEQFGARAVAYADYRYECLPFTRVDRALRRVVKKLVAFRDPMS